MTAEHASEDLSAAIDEAKDILDNPKASSIDKAIAEAILLLEQGKIEEALKIWRGIADTFEKVDRELTASAWLSVGYLLKQKPEDAIAAYDQAIRLQPDLSIAYNNRGTVKGELGRYEAAIADFDEAIRLNPNDAKAYNNRGTAKSALGQMNEARQDFERARDLARAADDSSAVASAEQALRDLDNQEGE